MQPKDSMAEQYVLGTIISNPKTLFEISQVLQGDDFYSKANQIVWKGLVELSMASKKIDIVTLGDWIHESGQMVEVTYPYLVELAGVSTVHYLDHAQVVRNKAIARQLLAFCHELMEEIQDPSMTFRDLLSHAEKRIYEISQRGALSKSHTKELAQAMNDHADLLEDRIKSKREGPTGIPSGLVDLDWITSGFHQGQLTIVAARPSVGKTALGLNIFANAVLRHDVVGMFFSVEQSEHDIADRFYSMHAEIDSHRLRRGILTHDEQSRLSLARQAYSRIKAWVNDQAGITALQIFSEARRVSLRNPLQLVVVDYLQLVNPDNRKVQRYEQVGAITKTMKHIARELNVPVLVMAQVGRDSDKDGRPPRLSELRESGDIEQDADNVIFLHDPTKNDPANTSETVTMEVIVAKQRQGATGTLRLSFRKPWLKFFDMPRS